MLVNSVSGADKVSCSLLSDVTFHFQALIEILYAILIVNREIRGVVKLGGTAVGTVLRVL